MSDQADHNSVSACLIRCLADSKSFLVSTEWLQVHCSSNLLPNNLTKPLGLQTSFPIISRGGNCLYAIYSTRLAPNSSYIGVQYCSKQEVSSSREVWSGAQDTTQALWWVQIDRYSCLSKTVPEPKNHINVVLRVFAREKGASLGTYWSSKHPLFRETCLEGRSV